MKPSDLGLSAVFGVARRRLRAAWLVATGQNVVPFVGGAAVALVLLGWLAPWRWPEPAAFALSAAAGLALVGYAVVFRLSDFKVARALDRGLEHNDAVTSALEVDPTNPFAQSLFRQVESLTPADASRAVRVPFNYKPWLIGLGLLAAAVILAVVRNPADDDRDRLAEERLAIEQVADTVEARAEELAQDPLTAPLAEELGALAETLAAETELEKALEQLEAAAEQIDSQTDAESLAQRAASLGLSRTLEASPLAAGSTPAEQLAALAAQANDLSDEDLAALAERLAELAATQEAGDPATAEALASAAQAAAAGNPGAMAAALGAAADSSATAASSAQAGLAGNLSAAELRDLADSLAAQGSGQAQGQGSGQGQGQGQGQGTGQGQGSGQGEGQGSGQGQGQGQGSGQGQGQGSGGGGMQATGNNPSGVGSGSNPDGTNNNTGASPEHAEATVVIPAGGESEILDASAQATGDGTTADPNRANGLTTEGRAGVPVRDVVNDYGNQAVDALDTMSLAPSETEAVRSYFDYLATTTGGN